MNDKNHKKNELREISRKIELEFDNFQSSLFSKEAFTTLKLKTKSYVSIQFSEALNISRRHQADNVSASHVERANEQLIQISKNRIVSHLSTIGSILLGVSLSNIINMTVTEQYSNIGIFISAGFGIVGAFSIALNFKK